MSGIPSNSTAAGSVPEYSYSFRIVDLLYVIAVFAAAFAAFGLYGILTGSAVVLFWAIVFANSSQRKVIIGASAVALGAIYLFWPRMTDLAPLHRGMACRNNLCQIAIALNHYRDTWGAFPPAYIADNEGRPMHSWRVLILPYVDEKNLYEAYDFSEPWDGPNNSKLITRMPSSYLCPSHRGDGKDTRQYTSYVAVVGDEAGGPLRGNAMQKGAVRTAANPIMLIEDGDARIPWTQPTDWNVDDALSRVTSADLIDHGPHREEDFFFEYTAARNAALADASVHYYYDAMGRENWTHLLKIDGSEAPSGPEGIPESADKRTVKVANWLRLAAFVMLSILPLPWVWRKPGSARAESRIPAAEPLR